MNCVVFATVEHLSRSPKDKDGERLDCCSAGSSAAPSLLQEGLLLRWLQPPDGGSQRIESRVESIETSVDRIETFVDAVKSLVDRIKALIDRFELLVEAIEAVVDAYKMLVDPRHSLREITG